MAQIAGQMCANKCVKTDALPPDFQDWVQSASPRAGENAGCILYRYVCPMLWERTSDLLMFPFPSACSEEGCKGEHIDPIYYPGIDNFVNHDIYGQFKSWMCDCGEHCIVVQHATDI